MRAFVILETVSLCVAGMTKDLSAILRNKVEEVIDNCSLRGVSFDLLLISTVHIHDDAFEPVAAVTAGLLKERSDTLAPPTFREKKHLFSR